jgi:hypothetical protein
VFDFRQGQGRDFFFLRHCLHTGSVVHPASYSLTRRGKATGLEAYHSSPPSAEIKNTWSYTSTSAVHLLGTLKLDVVIYAYLFIFTQIFNIAFQGFYNENTCC